MLHRSLLRRSAPGLFGLLALTLLAAPVATSAADYTKIDMAASTPGGAWYVGMGAIVKAVSDDYPDMEVSLFSGGGGIANVIRVDRGESQIGISAHGVIVAGNKGIAPFKKGATNVAGLVNLRDVTRLHFVVPDNSKITKLSDIRDKKMPIRLGSAPVGTNTELFSRWVLEEYGMAPKTIASWGGKVYTANNAETVSMLQDGQMDMDMWIGPGEAFRYQEVQKTKKLRLLEVDAAILKAVQEKYGLQPGVIPGSYYEGQMSKGDIPVATATTELIIGKDVPDDIAYKITKSICEHRDDIVLALPSWASFQPETAWEGLAAPLHPGAARYYKEKGWMK